MAQDEFELANNLLKSHSLKALTEIANEREEIFVIKE